jgi:hypothetical protein
MPMHWFFVTILCFFSFFYERVGGWVAFHEKTVVPYCRHEKAVLVPKSQQCQKRKLLLHGTLKIGPSLPLQSMTKEKI